jgi:hypothetical protein
VYVSPELSRGGGRAEEKLGGPAGTHASCAAAGGGGVIIRADDFAGRIGLMSAALIIMRLLPEGFSYYLRNPRQSLRVWAGTSV